MSDVEIQSKSDGLSHITGESEAGIEFIDAYIPKGHPLAVNDMQVLDAGRILLVDADVDEFVSACQKEGLTVEQREGV